MREMLRTNQMQMELMAEMIKVLGKVADILVPSGPPEALTGRFGEEWMIPDETQDGRGPS
jgi:hypothetical protein